MTSRALVVGAGPAGMGAALQLASWCESVTVIETQPRGCLRQAGEHLPPAGLTALSALGLEELLRNGRHCESTGVRAAWGDTRGVDKDYFMSLPGQGLNLRRGNLDDDLVRYLQRRGVVFRFDARLTDVSRHANGFAATVQEQDERSCLAPDLLVDATGRRAAAARMLGARRQRCDALVGLVGTLALPEPLDDGGRISIEAVETGWWYAVQLEPGRLQCTFMTDSSELRSHRGAVRAWWREKLSATPMLGACTRFGTWNGHLEIFDAASQWLDYAADDRFVTVGDAAMAFDPLSSWGIAKGLCDGHAAAAALQEERRGRSGAVAGHRIRQRRLFEQYRTQHQDYYRAEVRWPESPFWRSRQHVAATDAISGGYN